MEVRYPPTPQAMKHFSTAEVRENFLVSEVFVESALSLVYSHVDRVIAGGACPTYTPIALAADKKELGANYFLERRELGVVHVGGGSGTVIADGTTFNMSKLDGLYVGQGTQAVTFASEDPTNPARFYLASAPAHMTYPTVHIPISTAAPLHLGDDANSNKRTIYKYIHPDGPRSCQLVMGVTLLAPNNMWNTMPVHTHVRRMEVYFYFDLAPDSVVFHLLGEPDETRHIVIRNEQAVISPSWSIHSGVGTSNYSFVWAMAGENQTFSDMDGVSMDTLA